MRTRAFLLVSLLVPGLLLAAQPRSAVLGPLLAAQSDEGILTPALKAVVMLAAPPAPDEPLPVTATGVDASRVPLLDTELFRHTLAPFFDQPASLPSIGRMEDIVRTHLRIVGYPLANVYAPPQDITDGILRLVVQLAALDGDVQVHGARWFSTRSYAGALQAKSGGPLDLLAINDAVAWLNRNPFREVRSSAEAGSQRGTTRLVLNTQEKLPLELNAGYSNTGTAITDTDRVSAGLFWGNALGRGDLVRYGYAADPASRHLRSHSGSYTAFLPWRHLLTVHGAWSHLTPAMPVPFVQDGTSWQTGVRYEIPLGAPRPGWTQSLSFGADFKYSDNTLEFAAIPVTDNVTHVAQAGATYGVTFPLLGGRSSVTVSGYASPGGLTRYNKTRAFAGSRPGAHADYVYGKLTLTHERGLPFGFSWSTLVDLQAASGALLGTEQLGGAGAYAVRGYRENRAFGDGGVVINNELHAPAVALPRGRGRLDLFGFVDAASLNLRVDDESTDLRSAGFGANYQLGRHLSLRAAYGWQLKHLDASSDRGRGHVAANVSW